VKVSDPVAIAKRRAYWRLRRDTVDADVPSQGVEKKARMDLGLTLLSTLRAPGASFSYFDIAIWCGCTDGAIYLLEKQALKKLGNALRFGSGRGVGAEIEGREAARTNQLRPDQVKAAVARQWRKSSHGARTIPDYVVQAMHTEYLRTGSLAAAAAKFSRTKQDLAYIFKSRGLHVNQPGGDQRSSKRRAA
jgi:hypothetical protein